jgi:hypothetical protein
MKYKKKSLNSLRKPISFLRICDENRSKISAILHQAQDYLIYFLEVDAG